MIYDGTNGEPIKVEGGMNQTGLAVLEVTWLAAGLEAAWGIAPALYSGLQRTDLRLKRVGGGAYEVSGTYEGVSPEGGPERGDPEDEAVYELDVSQTTVPIAQHPKIADLEKIYGKLAIDKETGLTTFPKTAPQASSTGGLGGGGPAGESRGDVSAAFGITDYLDIGAIWRKSWAEASTELPPELFDNLGRIDTPEGPAPQANQGRNWLKTSVRASGRGKAWECSMEWTLSGRGGWLRDIYKTQ